MTKHVSNFSRLGASFARLVTASVLAGCAIWLGLQYWPGASAPANCLPELHKQEAVEHLKKEGLYKSLAEAVEAARYKAKALPSGEAYQFSNPAQGLRATFTHSGARVVSSNGGREVVIKPIGYGYGSGIIALDSHNIAARGNRIEHEYFSKRQSAIRNPQSAIREWFVNTKAGIEHGFTLPEPPPIERGEGDALRVEMEVGGGFEARLDAAGQAVVFGGGRDGEGLIYDKLKVYDARGRELTSRFELEGKRLAIVVEDGKAEYPLAIDPQFAPQTKLMANDGATDDNFGQSVAISGATAVVGAPGDNTSQGAAYVFVLIGTTWTQQQKLTASDGAAGDQFGRSVAISGDTVVIGAPGGEVGINAQQGSAYVFVLSGTASTQRKLIASDGEAVDAFGISVAIDGGMAVVGAPFDDIGANVDQGSAYVFPIVAVIPANPVLPAGAVGQPYNLMFTASGGTAPFAFAVIAGALPPGLTLAQNGTLSGTPTTPGTFTFTVQATDSVGAIGLRAYTLTVNPPSACPTINVNPIVLPPGRTGQSYSQIFTASGGTAPHTFSVIAGALPPGLTLSPTGQLSGVPTASGVFRFTVAATDANLCQGSRAYTLVITGPSSLAAGDDDNNTARNVALVGALGGAGALIGLEATRARPGPRSPVITFNPATLAPARVGQPYAQTFTTSDGAPPHGFTVINGALPPGLTLDSGGNLSGMPAAAGSFTFSVAVTDAGNRRGERAYTLVVNQSPASGAANPDMAYANPGASSAGSAISINPESLPARTAGLAYKRTLTAAGGAMPFDFSVAGGSLPQGLTLEPTGLISGTPTSAGTFKFTARVKDRSGQTAAREFAITVNPACSKLSLTPVKLPDGELGAAYGEILKADGGTGPYAFTLSAGALPTGLSFDPATGSIRGEPSQVATSDFTIRAVDSGACVGEIAYSLQVRPGKPATAPAAGATPKETSAASPAQTTPSARRTKAAARRSRRGVQRKRSQR